MKKNHKTFKSLVIFQGFLFLFSLGCNKIQKPGSGAQEVEIRCAVLRGISVCSDLKMGSFDVTEESSWEFEIWPVDAQEQRDDSQMGSLEQVLKEQGLDQELKFTLTMKCCGSAREYSFKRQSQNAVQGAPVLYRVDGLNPWAVAKWRVQIQLGEAEFKYFLESS